MSGGTKIGWLGTVVAVQPRILLTRSFDQRSHTYLGYVLRVRGTVAGRGSPTGPHDGGRCHRLPGSSVTPPAPARRSA